MNIKVSQGSFRGGGGGVLISYKLICVYGQHCEPFSSQKCTTDCRILHIQFFSQLFWVKLCADELVVGGGVGWFFLIMTGGGGAPRIFHRRRWRGFMVGGGGVDGVRPDDRALKQRTRWTSVFFLVLQGSATSHVISARPLAPKS